MWNTEKKNKIMIILFLNLMFLDLKLTLLFLQLKYS